MLDHLQKPRKRKTISKPSSKKLDHKPTTRARRMLILASCLLLFFTFVLFAWQTKLVFAKTTYVHSGQSIQVAINAANPNDIIFVYNGTYNENLVVNQSSLTLIGQNPTTTRIVGTANGTVIRLEASRIKINGFTISNGSNTFDAIVADNDKKTSDYHEIRNNVITTSQNGLYFHLSNSNIVENNTFYGNGLSSIYLLQADSNTFTLNNITESTYGMRILASQSNTIINNRISKTHYGIHLKSVPGSPPSTSNVIRNNTVSGKVAGIHIESDSNTVDHNTITDSAYGIQFQNAKNGIIYHNTLIQNSFGIRLWTTYPTTDPRTNTAHTVYNNKALNNGWGIQVENSTGNTFWGNWLQENSWGVYLYTAYSNTFYHNNFVNNAMQASEMGGNQWNTTAQGNFWSDYTGQDVNPPYGIGDTPYRIIPGRDYFPLMHTWSEHDVAVTSVIPSKSQANQGEIVTITVKVRNNDNITASETFTVTAKYNNTIIGTQQVTALPQGTTNILYFNWNTTGVAPGNYTIRAQASTVTDELNTDNNSLTDGTVKIKQPLIGDINGDGTINAQDLAILQQAYGSSQGSSNWNPNADLNHDNTVDEQDLYILSQNYGKTA